MAYRVEAALKLFQDGAKCFGPGIAELMERIDRAHSLRAAAGEMNMAYSKAWTVVGACERALGFALIERETGGRLGGGSRLTEKGRTLLCHYRELQRRLDAAAAQIAGELFEESLLP